MRRDENGNYNPDNDMTRAEFAATIVRALGLAPTTGASSFSDVNISAWYCGYVETASAYEIINGYGDGTFGPNDLITREQAMTMMSRAMGITGLDAELTDAAADQLLSAFSDRASVSVYAEGSIAACIKNEVVFGKTDDTIAPQDSITRAEVAVMVSRLLQKSELI